MGSKQENAEVWEKRSRRIGREMEKEKSRRPWTWGYEGLGGKRRFVLRCGGWEGGGRLRGCGVGGRVRR